MVSLCTPDSAYVCMCMHICHALCIYAIQWALVYPTMSVPHKMCQINQVLDKPGVG